jgi:hypothetical protein
VEVESWGKKFGERFVFFFFFFFFLPVSQGSKAILLK